VPKIYISFIIKIVSCLSEANLTNNSQFKR